MSSSFTQIAAAVLPIVRQVYASREIPTSISKHISEAGFDPSEAKSRAGEQRFESLWKLGGVDLLSVKSAAESEVSAEEKAKLLTIRMKTTVAIVNRENIDSQFEKFKEICPLLSVEQKKQFVKFLHDNILSRSSELALPFIDFMWMANQHIEDIQVAFEMFKLCEAKWLQTVNGEEPVGSGSQANKNWIFMATVYVDTIMESGNPYWPQMISLIFEGNRDRRQMFADLAVDFLNKLSHSDPDQIRKNPDFWLAPLWPRLSDSGEFSSGTCLLMRDLVDSFRA